MDRRILLVALPAALLLLLGGAWWLTREAPTGPRGAASVTAGEDPALALLGEARRGGVTLALPEAVGDVAITEARRDDAPLVLIDPGHGGRDGGATGAAQRLLEKQLTLAMAQEVRDRLAARGQVRVALTRDDDATLTLDQRAQMAQRLDADLFVSLHMDAAPNPQATGVTVYSLADIASSTEAAALAAAERERVGTVASGIEDGAAFLLTDLALRDQMAASAAFARRFIRRADGQEGVPLRPTPHQFANFWVLRFSQVPGVLLEAGYISNDGDERRLGTREGRAPLVETLARAIEGDLARRVD